MAATTTMLWDDTIDWGDEDSSTISTCKYSINEVNAHTEKLPTKKGLSKSVTAASRPVTPPKNQGRLGKRSSWFDWFESDEGSHSSISHTSKEKENTKFRNTSESQDESALAPSPAPATAFLPQSLLSLVPLEDEGMSTKQYKKTARRRTLETMGNDDAALLALREKAKSSTKDQSKLVKKSSKGTSRNSSQEKLHVPFPSRPRRRSAW